MELKQLRSDCAIVFVHQSHEAYRWLRRTLADTDLAIMWVQDHAAALSLVRTADVSLIIGDSREAGPGSQAFFNELFRLAPGTRQLMISLPCQSGSDSPVSIALADAVQARALPTPTANASGQSASRAVIH